MTGPPVKIGIDAPAWLTEPAFTLKEIAALTGAPPNTVSYWSTLAAAAGYELSVKPGPRRLLSAHGAYVVSVLRHISAAHVTLTASLVKSVLQITFHQGRPVLPNLFDQLHLHDGPVVIEVELSQIWLKLEPQLSHFRSY
ncbi:hypothetical protein [Nitrobacter vulgaris]|uniref:Uncharacterized protein n=1 Tax=Nitrobacter vulgaris TaxID=29421 RepID=A0A1V4I2W2_NITVU|nr:hypothetical protein [Nitrobacter vulgaris]OPH84435.1 hypothetical protein B2M20_01460 [Nitrobacter vulgaris]